MTRAREIQCWRLRQRFWSQARIAKKLGITQSRVSQILAGIEARELARLSADVERVKVRQTLQLEHVAEEAMKAWRRSLAPAETTTTTTGGTAPTGGSAKPQTSHTIKGQSGNPQLLAQAIKALSDIRAIWGLDAPPKASIPPPPPDPSEDDYDIDLSNDDPAPEESPPSQSGVDGAA